MLGLGLDERQTVDAPDIAGSTAGGIIEYIAEGTWTKRIHAGGAAQSGIRAALLARNGFSGPRIVFEGTHGLFFGFANTTDGDYTPLLDGLGSTWLMETGAFEPPRLRHDDPCLHRLRDPDSAAARTSR